MSRGGRGGGGRGGRTNDILSGRGERDISNGVGGRDIPSSGDGHTLSNTGKEQDKFSGDDYDEHDKFNGGGRHGNHGGGPARRLGMHKRLGGDPARTTDPRGPRGYSTPFSIIPSNK
nr:putative DEAD-box ATP-dependent RNA helicase 29 isoform X1 [Anas platyrhynchos]